jgi:hypothetical protein
MGVENTPNESTNGGQCMIAKGNPNPRPKPSQINNKKDDRLRI